VEVLPVASLVDQYGPFLRVEEAARLLRISRTAAYALANRWLDTNGTGGLPALRLGRSIRIPTTAIERFADPNPMPPIEPLRLVDAD
jgi:excisionase family DNA binding protein